MGIDESLDFGPAGRDWNADFGLIRWQCGGIKRLRQEKERDRREKEDLLDEVSRQNGNLEIMVRERTMSLEASEQELENSIAKLREEHRQRLLLSKQLIELLERERGQWAMDIHDHIGQSLASIKMGIERLLQQVGKSDNALSDKISALRDGTVNLISKWWGRPLMVVRP